MFVVTKRAKGRQGPPWEHERRVVVWLLILAALLGALMTQVALGTPGPRGPYVLVRPGETLWGIASQRYPQTDPRQAISAIEAANHLDGALITPGERLLLPPA
ncbi:MAG: LysM peptidoglycan-binding domain-containing protein [Candidatus Dormibacteria bacterium]